MLRKPIAIVDRDRLIPRDPHGRALAAMRIGSTAWFTWLAEPNNSAFSYHTHNMVVTVRREERSRGRYWYAYRRQEGRLRKVYLGKTEELTRDRLHTAVAALVGRPVVNNAIQLQLLGPPRLFWQGEQVTITVAKALALLAYLAVQRGPHRRERVLTLLWPESAERAARKNLRNVLWKVRAVLGNVVHDFGDWLALDEAVQTDIHTFQGLTNHLSARTSDINQAYVNDTLNVYRGVLLEGVTLVEAPDFEVWLTTEREHLEQLYLRGLLALLQQAYDVQQWHTVLEVGQRMLMIDPLRESVYRNMMEAHARLDDRIEALRLYATLRDTLGRELGVEPVTATESLRTLIKSGMLGPTKLPSRVVTNKELNPPLPSPFIGRRQELALLDQALANVGRGHTQVVHLVGEPGIGKTRLWQVWSASRLEATPVIELRGTAATQALPLAPVQFWLSTTALGHRLLGDGVLNLDHLVNIARMLPEIRAYHRHKIPAPSVLPEGIAQRLAFDALAQGIIGLSASLCVVFVDDLHWVDLTTLAWLGYLLERLRAYPLLLISAYRPQDASQHLHQTIADWEHSNVSQQLPIPRLSGYETSELFRSVDGDPSLLPYAEEQSAGNPYVLLEFVRSTPGTIPASVEKRIRGCIVHLSDEARQVMDAAALLDPSITLPMLQRVSGRSEEEVLDWLDTLLHGEILTEIGGYYTFTHPLVGTIVRRSMSIARRTAMLRRAEASGFVFL